MAQVLYYEGKRNKARMEHIQGRSREQVTLFPESLEEYIAEDNPVRFIDAYVDSLDMKELGFVHAIVNETGRPPYDPKDPLKLYIYGLLNRTRSSRLLEKETKRNVEVMWLIRQLSPDHKSISDFRKNNGEALKKVSKEFMKLCKKIDLYGSELSAIDSSVFNASNSRANIVSPKTAKIKKDKIDIYIEEYLEELNKNDDSEEEEEHLTKEELTRKINQLQTKKKELEAEMENKGHDISLIDKDCRLIKDKEGYHAGYRLQAAVDSKYGLIVDYQITPDASDSNYLSVMAIKAKEALGVDKLTVVADTAYYDTVDLQICENNEIVTYLEAPKSKGSNKCEEEYQPDKFTYNENNDTYICPEGQILTYRRTDKKDGKLYRKYKTSMCKSCKNKNRCTPSPRGREIWRLENIAVLNNMKERMKDNPEIYKKRKSIIEHVFGTIKKIWNYHSLQLRGLNNVGTEAALMCLAYNMRRAINIVGVKNLILATRAM